MRVGVRSPFALLLFAGLLVAAPARASLVWEEVPGAPKGEIRAVAAHGSDLAVAWIDRDSTPAYRGALSLRSGNEWQRLPMPGASGTSVVFGAVALDDSRVAATTWASNDPVKGADGIRVWLWSRAAKTWSALPDVRYASTGYEQAAGVEVDGEDVLLLTSRCYLLRWRNGKWSIVDNWPIAAFERSTCAGPFVRDAGRLFIVAGAIFEYRNGQLEYPLQPEGFSRLGVAVQPEGLAFLQDGPNYSGKLFLPGRPAPLDLPLFSGAGLFRAGGGLFTSTMSGPARFGEGRWSYTRLSEPLSGRWGPRGPFVEAGGAVYSAWGNALLVGRPSVRRLVPTVVRGSGRGGERYRTELTLANFGASPVTARLDLRAPEGLAAGRWAANVELGPGTAKRIEDVQALFEPAAGLPSAASLAIEFVGTARDEDAWAGADVVSLRDGREMRTFVPAPEWGSGPGFYIEDSLGPVLRLGPTVRTNVGWTDAGDGGPTDQPIENLLLGRPGDPMAKLHVFDTKPGQWFQRPLAELLPEADDGAVIGLSGPAVYAAPNCCFGWESISPRDVVAWAVEVDEGSGDGSLTLFETLSLDADRSSLFFPAVVRGSGSDGTGWSTELRLGPFTWAGRSATLRFRGTIGGEPFDTTWTLQAEGGTGLRFDVAADVVRRSGLADVGQPVLGTLSVVPEASSSRTLFGEARVTGRRDGLPGAFGVSMPGIAAGRLASTLAIVPGLSNDARLRSNLAVANAATEDGTTLTLGLELRRAADGVAVATAEATLAPGERRQWNDVGGGLPGAEGDLYVVVKKLAGSGPFAAYGVVHDRASGDGAPRPMTGVE